MITTTFAYDVALDYLLSNILISGGKAILDFSDNPGQIFSQPFNSDVGFTYDASKAEFTGGVVRQKANASNENFIQDFTNDTGFTYDNTKAEFASGLAKTKSQRPTDATFGATYTNNINGSWGNGVLTGTAFGGAAVSGGKLDLTGGTVKYVSYTAVANSDSYQAGCIKFKLTPDWTGVSIGRQCFFDIARAGGSDYNSISLRTVSGSTDLNLRLCDQNGNYIVNANFSGFSAISGQTYRFQLNYDFTTGQTRLYIDDVNIGGLHSGTGTRAGLLNQFFIGTNNSATQLARFKIDDFEVFSSVQSVGASVVPEYDYLESVVQCPAQSYLYNITSFGAPTTSEINAPKYIVNGYYWNGAAWVASSNTYATAMTIAQWIANIATFPGAQFGTGVTVKVIFQDSNTLSSIDQLDFTINEETYLSSTVVVPAFTYSGIGTLQSWDSVTMTDTNSPRYTVNGLYWNGSAWVASSDTWATASTAATILANMGTLPFNATFTVKIFFNAGNTQMSVDLLEATYTGQIYTTGTVTTNSILQMSALGSLTKVLTETGAEGSEIRFGLLVDNVLKYWTGAAWATSNGTHAQLNTITDINTNAATLIASGHKEIKIFARLTSASGLTTPELDTLSVIYSFGGIDPADPQLCYVWGYLLDISGAPISGATVSANASIKSNQYMEAQDQMLMNTVSTTTDATGYWELPLIWSSQFENLAVQYELTYSRTDEVRNKIGSNKILFTVPDRTESNIADILTAV